MTTHTGRVARYRNDTGYGFIAVDGINRPAFLHYTQLGEHRTAITLGSRVRFELALTPKGLQALNVVPIE